MPARFSKPFSLPDQLPNKPTLAPQFSIPVVSMGYSAPASFYLGERVSSATLDFLDENHLLFSFRVPGLLHREAGTSAEEERQIRAVVIGVATGAVEAEAVWAVHDRARYLWMLPGGRFLLRDRNTLKEADASLELKPVFRFPGDILWMDADPSGQYLVTESREPASGSKSVDPTAGAQVAVQGQNVASSTDLRLRILRRDSGQVVLTSRIRSTIRLPINNEGYLESLRMNATQWMVALHLFAGSSRMLGRVETACAPQLEFLTPRIVLATGCTASGNARLTALETDGKRLWEAVDSDRALWPLVTPAAQGSRFLRQTLVASHAVSARSPVDTADLKGQLTLALDAVDGQMTLAAVAKPIYDAGGNAALSPSGRRAAILEDGAIQIFDLPPVPELVLPVR
jgi:hypothetical protein